MQLSGNTPPWRNPRKAAYYNSHEITRSAQRVGLVPTSSSPDPPSSQEYAFPPNFLAMAKTTFPLRALLHIKATPSLASIFEDLAAALFSAFYAKPHANISEPSVFRTVLASLHTPRSLTNDEIDAIMAAAQTEEMKTQLRDQTKMLVEKLGAFGLPWLWVTRTEDLQCEGPDWEGNKGQPFWGSDRLWEVCDYLRVPCEDVKVISTKL